MAVVVARFARIGLAALLGLVVLSTPALAATVRAAVAANFTAVATALAAAFEAQSGDSVDLSFGATGALAAQLAQGAPFDVFLAADDKRTAKAVVDGFAVRGTEFTYAVGRLALFAPGGLSGDGEGVLKAGAFQHLAIADPQTAPYGAAAVAVLDRLGVKEAVAAKLVTGESISQTLQFIETGNAELGFVALSQVMGKPSAQVWEVPAALYPPIRQNAVLLATAADNDAAKAFLTFLQSDTARTMIAAAGYGLP